MQGSERGYERHLLYFIIRRRQLIFYDDNSSIYSLLKCLFSGAWLRSIYNFDEYWSVYFPCSLEGSFINDCKEFITLNKFKKHFVKQFICYKLQIEKRVNHIVCLFLWQYYCSFSFLSFQEKRKSTLNQKYMFSFWKSLIIWY